MTTNAGLNVADDIIFDTDAIGITGFVDAAGTIAGPDTNPHYWNMLRDKPVLSVGARLRNAWRELIR